MARAMNMIKNNHKKIILVEITSKGLFMCSKDSNEVIKCMFPEHSIEDMEVTDAQDLHLIINEFLIKQKLGNGNCVLIFSDDICFETDITNLPQIEQDLHENRFTELIPFESVVARRFVAGGRVIVAAINRTLFEFFRSTFISAGLNVTAAVPAAALKHLGYSQPMDSKTCVLLGKKLDLIRQQGFSEQTYPQKFASNQRHYVEKHQLVFAGLSTLAVIIALVTAFFTLRTPTPVISNNKILPSPTVVINNPMPETANKDLRISLSSPDQNSSESARLQNILSQAGFGEMEILQASPAGFLKVEVNNRLTEEQREQIMRALTEVYGEFTEASVEDLGEFDVVITF